MFDLCNPRISLHIDDKTVEYWKPERFLSAESVLFFLPKKRSIFSLF